MKNNSERGNVFLGLLLLLGVLLFGFWYIKSDSAWFKDQPEDDPNFETKMITSGNQYLIEITNKGFVPENVALKQYDTLIFVNKDVRSHRIVAGAGECLELESSRDLIQNDQLVVVFVKPGECEYQDYYNDDWAGQITVEKLTKEEKNERTGQE